MENKKIKNGVYTSLLLVALMGGIKGCGRLESVIDGLKTSNEASQVYQELNSGKRISLDNSRKELPNLQNLSVQECYNLIRTSYDGFLKDYKQCNLN